MRSDAFNESKTPHLRAVRTAVQAINASQITPIIFNVVRVSQNFPHNNITDFFMIPETGIYHLSAGLYIPTGTGDIGFAEAGNAANRLIEHAVSAPGGGPITVSGPVLLGKGTKWTLNAFSNTAQNVAGTSDYLGFIDLLRVG